MNSSSDTTFSRKRRSGSIAAVGPSPGFGLSSSGACTRTCSRTVGRRGFRRSHLHEDPESVLLQAMPHGFSDLSPIERTQVVEIETLLSSYLLSSQGDRVAMANSVEGRFVFLDHELIEFVSRIEPDRKMAGLREKAILKEVGRGMIPARILERKKFPYRAPDIESFQNTAAGRRILDEALDPVGMETFGLFDVDKVQALAAKVASVARRNGRVTTSDNLVLMGVLSGQIFHKIFFGPSVPAEGFHPHDRVRRIVRGTAKGEDEWLRATSEG